MGPSLSQEHNQGDVVECDGSGTGGMGWAGNLESGTAAKKKHLWACGPHYLQDLGHICWRFTIGSEAVDKTEGWLGLEK